MCTQPRCGAASTVTDLPSSRPSPVQTSQHRGAARLKEVTLLDYGAGNVRSVRNACRKLGYTLREVIIRPPPARGAQTPAKPFCKLRAAVRLSGEQCTCCHEEMWCGISQRVWQYWSAAVQRIEV